MDTSKLKNKELIAIGRACNAYLDKPSDKRAAKVKRLVQRTKRSWRKTGETEVPPSSPPTTAEI
jgi:hypothetical protein